MLPIGAIFAFIGRQLGRVLSLAFSWATMALFGRVPQSQVWSRLIVGLLPPDSSAFSAHVAAAGAGGGSSSGEVKATSNDPAQAERIFNALADGGSVQMPIAETFWAVRFGMVTDRYGTPWMINCEKPA